MSKKTKTTTKPAKEFMPHILGAANDLNSAYDLNAGTIQNTANQFTGMVPSMIEKYQQGNPGVNAAQGYNVDVLTGKYLDQGNPYLQQMIDQSGNDVRNQTQAALGVRGLTGGSDYAGLIADRVSQNSLGMRYSDYGAERDRMATASAQTPGLAFAEYAGIAPALSVAEAGMMPLQAASGYAGSLGGLLGGYTTQTQKPGLGAMLMQGAQNAAAAYAGGG